MVGDRLDVGDTGEQVREREGASPSIAEGPSEEDATADFAIGGVVVVQEDLLERRLAARQARHPMLGKLGDQWRHLPGYFEPQRARPRIGHLNAGQRAQPRSGARERNLIVCALRWRNWSSALSSTSFPARRIPMRSQVASTSLRMCEDKKTL